MEVADTIEEIKTTCHYCNRKAVFNLKHVNGVADCTGPAVQLGKEIILNINLKYRILIPFTSMICRSRREIFPNLLSMLQTESD